MSMSPDIMKFYLRLRTGRNIWTALAKAFFDDSDEYQIFGLNYRAFSIKTGWLPCIYLLW